MGIRAIAVLLAALLSNASASCHPHQEAAPSAHDGAARNTASGVERAGDARSPVAAAGGADDARSLAPTVAPGDGDASGTAATPSPPREEIRQIHMVFRPRHGPATSYAADTDEDLPRLVLMPGVVAGRAYPIVVALHGQPKRGVRPRDYEFAPAVLQEAERMVRDQRVPPFVLALPVFRFEGENWPGFDLAEYRASVEAVLHREDLRSDGYYVFGHSGAAGCGGGALNHAAAMSPNAVAFLDTCIGRGFVQSVIELRRAQIPTIVLHSVETAGFVPRQPTEYRTNFDFGRVDAPIGLAPIPCPPDGPEAPGRDQPYRCSATPDGVVRAFVVDTGAGEPAHQAALPLGTRFFLRATLSPK